MIAGSLGEPLQALRTQTDNLQLAPQRDDCDDEAMVPLADENNDDEQQSNTATTPTDTCATKIRHTIHSHHGGFSRVSKECRFPKGGLNDLWLQWNVPDTSLKMPPMRDMTGNDYGWLDQVEKTAAEQRLAPGQKPKKKWRATRNGHARS